MKKRALALILSAALIVCAFCACGTAPDKKNYGVFLSLTEYDDVLEEYGTVVIDAQYFSSLDIGKLKARGKKVITYLNVGSLEYFRYYYDDFAAVTLGGYENWEDERWLDVSDPGWIEFLKNDLVPLLLKKGVDGFFVDNCDVYYNYPKKKILSGLADIMRFLTGTGKEVIINGGDAFLDAYCRSGGKWDDVITGIDQEEVFSRIDFEKGTFSSSSTEDREYYMDYIERYAALGADVYLLEYTRSPALRKKIAAYCEKNGFEYYVSDSVELDG